MKTSGYEPGEFYDEAFERTGQPRRNAQLLLQQIAALSEGELQRRQQAAERVILNLGMTFGVSGSEAGHEHIFPFDVIPRIVDASDWARLESGLRQRVRALNEFVHDVYHEQKIVRDRVIPRELLWSSKGLLKRCIGLSPPKNIWCHISGIDLVRAGDGQYYVLEDNMRCPSGVAYVLEARQVMKRTFPELFEAYGVRPVDEYPSCLLQTLQFLSDLPDPTVVILTPGIYNSAYYEHSLLAQKMGVELVEARDLARSVHPHDRRQSQVRRPGADQAHLRQQPRRFLREVVRRLVLRGMRALQARRRDRRRQVRAASHARAAVDDGAQLVLPPQPL